MTSSLDCAKDESDQDSVYTVCFMVINEFITTWNVFTTEEL